MAGIDELPYRDPRTAYGGAATATRPRIPVGTATPATMGQFQAAQAAAATPAPGIGAMPAPPQAPTAPAPATTAAAPGGIGAAPANSAGRAYGVGNAAAKVVKGALPTAIGAGVVSDFNNYKINDPEVDSSAAGTFNAVKAGDFAGAAKSASKGALETLMDLGSTVANAADYVVPGKAPVSTAYNAMLKNTFGDQLVDNTAKPAEAPAAAPVAAQPAPSGIGAMPTQQVQAAAAPAPTAPTAPTAPPAGGVTFDPKTKTYSGTDVKEGAGITGGIGAGRGTGRGTVSSLDTSRGFRQDQMEAQRLVAERLDREAQSGGGLAGIGGGGATTMSQDLRAKTDAMTPKDILRAATQYGSRAAGAAVQAQQVQQQSEAASRNAEVSARGQDIGAMSQQAGNRTQRDIAAMQGRTQRDVAGINSDARVAAVEAKGAQPNKFTPVLMPDQLSPDGMTVIRGGQALMNNQTGEVTYPGQGTGGKPTSQVTPKAEYDKMPKGARYVGPDGKTYVKA